VIKIRNTPWIPRWKNPSVSVAIRDEAGARNKEGFSEIARTSLSVIKNDPDFSVSFRDQEIRNIPWNP
jgi:hypothetical protein